MTTTKLAKKTKRLTDKFRFIPTGKTGKLAAVWVRVSSFSMVKGADGKKEQRASVQAQKTDLISFAEKNGWSFQVYDGDCDVSGAADLADRPALQELTRDIESGKIHTIIVREMKRLFRDSAAQAEYISKIIIPNGIEIKSPFEAIDLSNPQSRMLLGLQAGIAENELVYIAEKSMRSKELLAKKGQLITPPAIGYGIKSLDGARSCYIKQDEAETVRTVYRIYIEKKSISEVIKELKRKERVAGFPDKDRIRITTLLRMIDNIVYRGAMTYEGVEYPSPYPPIIDAKQWTIANEIRKKKHAPANRKDTHLFTGILKCGYCWERHQQGMLRTSINLVFSKMKGWTKGKGRAYISIYKCGTKNLFGKIACPESPNLPAEKIEAAIDLLMEAGAWSFEEPKKENQVEELKNEIFEIKKKIARLKKIEDESLDMMGAGSLTPEQLKQILAKNKVALFTVEKKLAELKWRLEGMSNPEMEEAVNQAKKWKKLSDSQKKQALGWLHPLLLVYSDRIVSLNIDLEHGWVIPLVKLSGYAGGWQIKVDQLKQLKPYGKVMLPDIPAENQIT